MRRNSSGLCNHLDFTIASAALTWTALVFGVQVALHLHACVDPTPQPKFSDKMPMQRRPSVSQPNHPSKAKRK